MHGKSHWCFFHEKYGDGFLFFTLPCKPKSTTNAIECWKPENPLIFQFLIKSAIQKIEQNKANMELSLFQDHFLLRLENLLFVITAVISGSMLLWSMVTQRGIKEIDTRTAVQLINYQDALVLDVRDDSEFAAGHLPNAKHIPAEKIEERWAELQKFKEKPVVVIYRSGIRSNNASLVLKKNGFSQVVNLMGGIDSWKRAGLPMVKR